MNKWILVVALVICGCTDWEKEIDIRASRIERQIDRVEAKLKEREERFQQRLDQIELLNHILADKLQNLKPRLP